MADGRRPGGSKPKVPKLTDEERATIFDNLLHDLAVLDPTTEEEALAISERLIAEGRIDPAKTVEAHRRLLARLRGRAELESPQAMATGELLRAYEAYKDVPREEMAQELGVDMETLGHIESDPTPLPVADPELGEAGRRLAERVRGTAARIVNALRIGRMKLLESVGEPAEVYARKEERKKP